MRTTAALVAAVAGAFFAVGFAIAILFELQGFGRPRDTDPRVWYVALLVAGLLTCVDVPVRLAQRLGRRRRAGR